jgi:hypothetical protein
MSFAPPDQMVRKYVAITLEGDLSFRAFASNQNGHSRLLTQADSDEVHLAGAGAILCEYLKTEGEAN